VTGDKNNDLLLSNSANISSCQKYRYTLWRWWDKSKPFCMFIGLNPSTADAIHDDPTIRRCINYSKDWGYGGLLMANIFAYRSTDPNAMKTSLDPIGPDNDMWLNRLHKDAGVIVAAWGVHGDYMSRGDAVKDMIPNLKCLKLTKNGYPSHPLYLRKDIKPIEF